MPALLEQPNTLDRTQTFTFPVTPIHETPYLLISLEQIEQRYYEMTNAFPNITMHYAMKCNPDVEILKRLHAIGCHFEIASFPELEMLLSIGVKPAEVLFSNPVKPPSHIFKSYQAGLQKYAFDSISELEKISENAPDSTVYARLRTQANSSEVASEGKFGISPDAAIELLLQAKQYGLHPGGIAFHVGSQMLTPEAWTTAIQSTAYVMESLLEAGIRLQFVDIGGGYPARYSNFTPNFQEFGQSITEAIKTHLPYEVDIVAEPGRALVAEAGTMVATVIGLAQRDRSKWVHLDVGAFNGMMEALETGNMLQFPVSDSKADTTELYNLTGPSCDSQDTILYNVPLSHNLKIGDQVYLASAGAYTTSYASNFNGFSIPAIYYT